MTDTLGTVLIVEDDPALAELVAGFLTSNGLSVLVEPRGDRAPARVLAARPDVVVLDIMLPGLDGLEVCRRIRPDYDGAILMLTARGDDIDEVVGLEVGADDYVAKPVRPRVLLARIKSLLRRSAREPAGAPRRLSVGPLVVDGATRSVAVDGVSVELTTAEYDLLWVLAERAGQVVERDELYQLVRGIAWDGVDRSIDLRVSRLRKKLGEHLIKSVRGTGYLLAASP